ncbi:hypothetical protein [Halorhabdus rudnickae]|uniref:hypothetical protein n=1 Tax=Halorhabdus rudnickae TaxID=1775544 RepID=UPI0010845F06|nr:hypothetical protein [Halorhabdus rudnickae]
MSEFESAEVWGEAAESLPIRPLEPSELNEFAQKESITEVRIPETGQVFSDEAMGPTVTGGEGEISEFLVISSTGTVTQFRYGWPEVTSGELRVPRSIEAGVQEGYVKWWKNTLSFEDIEVDDQNGVEIGDQTWDYYKSRTVPLEAGSKTADN